MSKLINVTVMDTPMQKGFYPNGLTDNEHPSDIYAHASKTLMFLSQKKTNGSHIYGYIKSN